jgi:hypothetical protein
MVVCKSYKYATTWSLNNKRPKLYGHQISLANLVCRLQAATAPSQPSLMHGIQPAMLHGPALGVCEPAVIVQGLPLCAGASTRM